MGKEATIREIVGNEQQLFVSIPIIKEHKRRQSSKRKRRYMGKEGL